MRISLFYAALSLAAMFLISCKAKEDVAGYAPTEVFANDTLLKTLSGKSAMIVLAHDDDMCAMSGTIAMLNKQGWDIGVVSFTKTPERNAAQVEACRDILDTVLFINLSPAQIRNDKEDERRSYFAFPKDSFDLVFNRKVIEEEYLACIRKFDPEVIFTLDNEMGGYGHPEHVLISQMVLDLTAARRISPAYIYQSVYTDHMENSIMQRHSERMKSWGFPGDEWDKARKTYGVDGMPEPTVQINITDEAEAKMNYLRSYNKRERKTLGFFIPAFEDYGAKEYFTLFDREFFRVIDAKSLQAGQFRDHPAN